MVPYNPFKFLPKILIHTFLVPELLDSAKILPKTTSLCLRCNNVTDRQTDRRTAHAISRVQRTR